MAKNREKITYIDDGRTIADMSGVPDHRPEKRHPATPHPKFRDAWNTYWQATKMMLLPTLFFAGGLALIFGLCWLFFKFM
jgi:hypothetical protein